MTERAAGAGALLRTARERQGLHIAALAATLKVAPRKLEVLEAERFEELPDAAFTRALALSVCRTLKIDPAPVLELLPQAPATGLAKAAGGLNQPYRERDSHRGGDAAPGAVGRSPLLWGGGLLVLLALLLWALPERWWSSLMPAAGPATVAGEVSASAPAAAASAPVAPMPDAAASAASANAPAASVAAAPAVEVVHSAPEPDAGASAAAPAGIAVLRAAEPSWIEAVDAGGQVLLQRTLQPGETVGLDGRLPLRLRIGNVAGTQLTLRGEPVNLAPLTRDNTARLELK
jgi:cytoskeleton protein RodZ